MRWYPFDDESETYKHKIAMFENGQPEKFRALMNNFKTAIDGTGTTSAAEKIKYHRNMLGGEALQYFDKLSIQNTGTKNAHLKFIKEGLLGSFPSTDALSKNKGVIRHAMHKPCKILFK